MSTREQVKEFSKDLEYFMFKIKANWQHCDSGALNDIVDGSVEDGYLLDNLSYTPIRLDGDDIIIEVRADDLEEYFDEDNY